MFVGEILWNTFLMVNKLFTQKAVPLYRKSKNNNYEKL